MFNTPNSNTARSFSYYDVVGGNQQHWSDATHLPESKNPDTKLFGRGRKPPRKREYIHMLGAGLDLAGSGCDQKGYGRRKAAMMGAGCCKMCDQIGEGIGNMTGRGYDPQGAKAAREAPKFKKHLPKYAQRMSGHIMNGLGLSKSERAAVHPELTRFLLAQSRKMATGKQTGGAAWWNKIKSIAKKVKHFMDDTPAGRAIENVGKAAYENFVPGGVRAGLKMANNSALGKLGRAAVQEALQ